jgi:hypothetical protein
MLNINQFYPQYEDFLKYVQESLYYLAYLIDGRVILLIYI